MKACCNWCLKIVKVPDIYDRKTHRAYCSPHCRQADWLFRQWQNDTWLDLCAQMAKGGNNYGPSSGKSIEGPTKET